MRSSILAACCLLGLATPAAAADFLFSFGSTPGASGVGSSAVAGTTTGRILGLPETGTAGAAQVWIDSYSPNPLASPISVTGWADQGLNRFIVINGEIVGGGFNAAGGSGFFDRLFITFESGDNLINYASIGSGGRSAVWNAQGVSGVTFARLNSPVPEPGTWAMMLLGFGVVGCAARRARKRLAAC